MSFLFAISCWGICSLAAFFVFCGVFVLFLCLDTKKKNQKEKSRAKAVLGTPVPCEAGERELASAMLKQLAPSFRFSTHLRLTLRSDARPASRPSFFFDATLLCSLFFVLDRNQKGNRRFLKME
ncbi:MAG: hypothetical protein LUE93_06885 [Bacteroides sp.]|nr:hypothetical protein [Bacteroides sp.]